MTALPLAELSVANVRAHVEHITTQIPSRLAGSPNGRRMAEYQPAGAHRSRRGRARTSRCPAW